MPLDTNQFSAESITTCYRQLFLTKFYDSHLQYNLLPQYIPGQSNAWQIALIMLDCTPASLVNRLETEIKQFDPNSSEFKDLILNKENRIANDRRPHVVIEYFAFMSLCYLHAWTAEYDGLTLMFQYVLNSFEFSIAYELLDTYKTYPEWLDIFNAYYQTLNKTDVSIFRKIVSVSAPIWSFSIFYYLVRIIEKYL